MTATLNNGRPVITNNMGAKGGFWKFCVKEWYLDLWLDECPEVFGVAALMLGDLFNETLRLNHQSSLEDCPDFCYDWITSRGSLGGGREPWSWTGSHADKSRGQL